ncbi:MAG: helix-turn-helix domain-containing protein [Candidatus Methanospirareceae archaeon]
MERENILLKEAHVLLHPFRYRMAALLAERPLSLQELIDALGEDRRLISYHLLILEEHGFVRGKLVLDRSNQRDSSKAGVAYGVTEKGRISYQFLILEAAGVVGDQISLPVLPVMKRRIAREYQTTEKVDGVLSELKKFL